MKLKTLLATLRARNPLDTLRFARDVQSLVRMAYNAAIDSALLVVSL